MAETEFNHQCIICGENFHACNNCVKLNSIAEYESFNMNDYCEKHNITGEQKHQMFLGFRSTSCQFDHYLIFELIRNLKKKERTATEAKNELQALGYDKTNINTLKESVQNYLLENVYNIENNEAEQPLTIETKEATEEKDVQEEETQPKRSYRRKTT